MWRLKACPKCKGDIRLDQDSYGWYEQCIQCGYIRDLERLDATQEHDFQKEKEPGPC